MTTTAKKYELTGETREVDGVTVSRIRALRRVSCAVLAGDEGGWIQSNLNLSHQDEAWILRDAIVMDRAKVSGDTVIGGSAVVRGRATVSGRSRVTGDAVVSDRVYLTDNSHVSGSAHVFEDAMLCDNVRVLGRARVSGTVQMYGRSRIEGDAIVTGGTELRDAAVSDDATVMDRGQVIVISGFLPEPVTVYRAAGLTAGHVVVAGCQAFSLTRGGSPVASLGELADRHEWELPPGWKSLRRGLLTVVRGWQKLEAPQGAGVTGGGETGTRSLQVGA